MIWLVTGAAGFIGANFVHLMLQTRSDCRIIAYDKLTYAGNLENLAGLDEAYPDRYSFIRGDIADAEAVEGVFAEHAPSVVINFAAESHVDRSIHDARVFLETNVVGSQCLVDACRRHWLVDGAWASGKKYIQISTDEVYGSLPADGSFSESTPLAPRNPYAASKAAADMLVDAAHHTHGLPACTTRCSNNYGPYQFPEKLVPLMIRNAQAHEPLPVYGDGKHVRDWLYVDDHCRAIAKVIDQGQPGRVYNIGGNNERENIFVVRKLIDSLRRMTGDEAIDDGLIKHITDRLGHDRRYAIDATRMRHELSWRPEVDFESGIEQTIRWYLERSDWVERVISGEYQRFYDQNYAGR